MSSLDPAPRTSGGNDGLAGLPSEAPPPLNTPPLDTHRDTPAPADAAPSAAAFPLRQGEFVAMLAFVQALQALAVDSMLPALGTMSHDLGVTDPNRRQLVVGLFLIFGGLGSLVPGVISDRYGRRPVLLTCVAGYIVCAVAAAVAASFDLLLVARAAMGLASAGLVVLPSALVRDRFEGDRMARMLSMVAVIFMVVPMLAPSLGQAVLAVASWRWIFGAMALIAAGIWAWVYTRLPETLHPELVRPVRPRVLAQTLKAIVGTRAASGYVFGQALVQGALFGYINCSQQLIAEHFGAGPRFPLIFGGMALVMAVTNFANSRIVVRFGTRRVSHTAILAFIVISGAQLAMAMNPHEQLWQFVPLMTANLCLLGFIGANMMSVAMQPFAAVAGAAASVQAFLRLVLGSGLGILIGQAYDGTARPIAGSLLTAGVLALALVLYSERGRLFRRLHPPPPKG